MKAEGGKENPRVTWEESNTRSSLIGVGDGSPKADRQVSAVSEDGGMTPSAAIPPSSPSSIPEQTQLWVGLLAAPWLSPSSSSYSSLVAFVSSATSSTATEADATVAAASAAAWARASSSRTKITVEEEIGAATEEVIAAVATAKHAVAPIGGAKSSGYTSAGAGDLGVLEAMELGETRRKMRYRGSEWARAGANGSGGLDEDEETPFIEMC